MEDMERRKGGAGLQRRKRFHERYAEADGMEDGQIVETESVCGSSSEEGEEGWRNSEGERLRDFGVDEEAEFYDEDDIPLAKLIQRRKQMHS